MKRFMNWLTKNRRLASVLLGPLTAELGWGEGWGNWGVKIEVLALEPGIRILTIFQISVLLLGFGIYVDLPEKKHDTNQR